MKTTSIFRLILVVQFCLLLVSIISDSYLTQFLPEQLRNYIEWDSRQELTSNEVILLVASLPVLLTYFASIIGLYFFKPWSTKAYFGTSIIMLIVSPFLSPTVEHSLVTTLTYLEATCFGFILAFVFFNDVIRTGNKTTKLVKKEDQKHIPF